MRAAACAAAREFERFDGGRGLAAYTRASSGVEQAASKRRTEYAVRIFSAAPRSGAIKRIELERST